MKLDKSKILVAGALALGVAGASATLIHAQTTSTTSGNPMSNLVNAIATKFNLNVSDVQQVFDDQKAQMDEQRQQMEETRIQDLVTQGKLTQDQADKIVAKQKEVETFMESLKDKTPQQRADAMKSEMDSVRTWAQENNIPEQYLMMFGGHGGFGFRGHKFGGMWEGSKDTTNQNTSTN